jgi:quercetin dioxygenase-like cupin family protein
VTPSPTSWWRDHLAPGLGDHEYGVVEAEVGPRPAVTKGYMLVEGDSVPGADAGTKASAASTAGSLTLVESRIQGGPPRHVHAHEDESFYVLDGALSVSCGDDVFEAGPRCYVFLPRGVPHHFNTISGPATVLLIVTPGGIEAYFREIREAMDEQSQLDVGAKYDIRQV